MGNRFSSAKHSIAECDRCGFRFKLKILKRLVVKTKQIDMLVCPTCWEPDQPQLQLGMYPVDDPQGVRNPRPDRSYVASGPLADGFLGEGSRIFQWGWNPVGGGYTPIDGGTPNYLVSRTAVGTVTIELDAETPIPPPTIFYSNAVETVAGVDAVEALMSALAGVVESVSAGDSVSATLTSASMFSTVNTPSAITLSNGNLTAQQNTPSGNWYTAISNTSHNTGKYYFEMVSTTNDDASMLIGLGTAAISLASYPGADPYGWGIWANRSAGVYTYHNGSALAYGTTPLVGGGVARVAVDFAAGKMWFGLDGVWIGSGDPATGANPSYTFTAGTTLFAVAGLFNNVQVITANFGATAFSYSVPSGFAAWNT